MRRPKLLFTNPKTDNVEFTFTAPPPITDPKQERIVDETMLLMLLSCEKFPVRARTVLP